MEPGNTNPLITPPPPPFPHSISQGALSTLISASSTLSSSSSNGSLSFSLDMGQLNTSPCPSTSGSTATSPRKYEPFCLEKRVVLGICAMDKKTKSKPMTSILDRLRSFGEFDILIFGNKVILEDPIEEWPIVDCLVAFYSDGFPMEKVQSYVKLRNPFMINDLDKQNILLDRSKVYQMLQAHGIAVPRHIVYDHTSGKELIEEEDYIVYDGVKLVKPFVEKPISGEDHNIYIYYPKAAGGGSKRLYRKVENRSSTFYPDIHNIRRDGCSYIYEEFMPTGGTDLKVYTVGTEYAHAEARKSPVVDGRVQRDAHGKEIRYPVILTSNEKEMARRVVTAFGQLVCGFDLLRSSMDNTSYVCDVNGWSFVKNSQKYYEDCAQLLRVIMINKIYPEKLNAAPYSQETPQRPGSPYFDLGLVSPTKKKKQLEVRCVIAVIRHGDRTPKQKLKMRVIRGSGSAEKFLELFVKHGNPAKPREELKLKTAVELQDVLDITRQLLQELEEKIASQQTLCEADIEAERKLGQIKTVLEKGGHFSGINRKVQFKPLIWKKVEGPDGQSEDEISEALFIVKWGGQLTDLGLQQAQALGSRFRLTMYPGEDGLLRLHSTYRHDLKIYASDEGRVQVTAAGFAKSFLNLEGKLTPILVSLVRKDKFSHFLLDDASEASEELNKIKIVLSNSLNQNVDLDDEMIAKMAPTKVVSLIKALQNIKNPWQALQKTHELIKSISAQVDNLLNNKSQITLSNDETLNLMHRRWMKLDEDFFNQKKGVYDISKVPDIYDCIHYDMLHNRNLKLKGAEELYSIIRDLAGYVVPQEYGITQAEKFNIGLKICEPLLRKISYDLKGQSLPEQWKDAYGISAPEGFQLDPRHTKNVSDFNTQRHVRTRLYFTSESHIHSLLNVLRYAPMSLISPEALKQLETIPQLNYITQIVFKVYENFSVEEDHPERNFVEVLLSPGTKEYNSTYASSPNFPIAGMMRLNSKMCLSDVEAFFESIFATTTPAQATSAASSTAPDADSTPNDQTSAPATAPEAK